MVARSHASAEGFGGLTELPGLFVSVMALFAVQGLSTIFSSVARKRKNGSSWKLNSNMLNGSKVSVSWLAE